MYNKDRVLSLVRIKGPVIPVQLSKELGTNILMTSAMLSELSSKNEVVVSSIKIGGSPLYYVKGQEEKLQQFVDKLNGKEREAYDILRKSKVVLDTDLEPAIRVAMRSIKDFAKPLEVQHNQQHYLFWKWFLQNNEEATPLIKEKLGAQKGVRKEVSTQKQLKHPLQRKAPPVTGESFLGEINAFFATNNIEVSDKQIKRKNAELDFIVEVPSSVGKLKYYCKAKTKKVVNDGDLSSAFIQSQSHKLPCLFLIKGKLTKKAEEILQREFKGMTVKKI